MDRPLPPKAFHLQEAARPPETTWPLCHSQWSSPLRAGSEPLALPAGAQTSQSWKLCPCCSEPAEPGASSSSWDAQRLGRGCSDRGEPKPSACAMSVRMARVAHRQCSACELSGAQTPWHHSCERVCSGPADSPRNPECFLSWFLRWGGRWVSNSPREVAAIPQGDVPCHPEGVTHMCPHC